MEADAAANSVPTAIVTGMPNRAGNVVLSVDKSPGRSGIAVNKETDAKASRYGTDARRPGRISPETKLQPAIKSDKPANPLARLPKKGVRAQLNRFVL